MSWVDSAIWWQVYPLGFGGAEKTAAPDQPLQHRLPGSQWLDYLVELGCNGLALGPIFASETHGYDSVDLMRLDARLGDDHDFDTIIYSPQPLEGSQEHVPAVARRDDDGQAQHDERLLR